MASAPTRLAVFLRSTPEPDFVTTDGVIVGEVLRKYGSHLDMLVMANGLAHVLGRTPITDYLATTEECSMVRLVLSN